MLTVRQDPAPAFALEGDGLDLDVLRAIQVHNVFGAERPQLLYETVGAYRRGFRARPAVPGELTLLEPGEGRLGPAETQATETMLAKISRPAGEWERVLDDLGWKVALVPRGARRVLALGVGDGLEVLLLRAQLGAEAEITAVDYRRDFGDDLERVAGLRFEAGDLVAYAAARPGAFDLVWSHHAIEHLADPNRACAALAGAVAPGGSFVAALPLAADPRLGARCRRLARWAARPERIGPLDVNALYPRHTWKTNAGDLRATLEAAGLRNVQVYQRRDRVSRGLPPGGRGEPEARWRRRRAALQPLNRATFGALRAALKAAGGDRLLPRGALRALYSLERRVPFGEPALTDALDPDAVVVARRLPER